MRIANFSRESLAYGEGEKVGRSDTHCPIGLRRRSFDEAKLTK